MIYLRNHTEFFLKIVQLFSKNRHIIRQKNQHPIIFILNNKNPNNKNLDKVKGMIKEKINNVEPYFVLIMVPSIKSRDFLATINITVTNQKIYFILQDQINQNPFVVL